MTLEERIRHYYGQGIESQITAADSLASQIAVASECLSGALLSGHKLFCGADREYQAIASLFNQLLVDRPGVERPSLPIINLAKQFPASFSKIIHALGHEQDCIILLSGPSPSTFLIDTIHAAHQREMRVILVGANRLGNDTDTLNSQDVLVPISDQQEMARQTNQLMILHIFANLIDGSLFGYEE